MMRFSVYFVPEFAGEMADTSPMTVECEYMEEVDATYYFRNGTNPKQLIAIMPAQNVWFIKVEKIGRKKVVTSAKEK